jgi:hypothetical protein
MIGSAMTMNGAKILLVIHHITRPGVCSQANIAGTSEKVE